MELTQLLYFKTVAECGSMSRAAEKLHVSQPALSFAVKKLESELEARLFDRGKNGLVLNGNGRRALARATEILNGAEALRRLFSGGNGDARTLSLCFCDPGPMRFSLPRFQRARPEISVAAEMIPDESALEDFLLFRRFDAVVSLREPKAPEIDGELFARETLMLSVPREHPWARRKSVLLAGEKSFRLAVLRGDGAYVRRLKPFLERIARERGVEIFDDGFVFLQQPDLEKIPALTTRLVRRYRSEGTDRVFVPLEDEGVSAEYRISYLRGNRSRRAPFLAWARETRELLSGD